jgi:hypothetical protein
VKTAITLIVLLALALVAFAVGLVSGQMVDEDEEEPR